MRDDRKRRQKKQRAHEGRSDSRRGRARRRTPLERLVRRLFPSLDKHTIRLMLRVLRTGVIALGTLFASVWNDRGVDADELIQRASEAERATPVAVRAVGLTFVRQDTGESVRLVRQMGVASLGTSTPVVPDDVPSIFRPVLKAIGFDWRRPLTIDIAVRYRIAHPLERAERVARQANRGGFVLISTAASGDLRELQVSVDAESYQVVREHLTFPGIGTLDIEDLSRTTAYLPRRAGIPVIRPSRDELDRAELRVRLLLADAAADLEQRVQISRTPESVRVQTDAGGARWDPLLGTQLRALAHVRVDVFTSGTGTHVVPPDLLPTRFGLERWRERRFGSLTARASVLPQLMESLVTVRRRLTVLADLATRYPDSRRDLSTEARALLRQLVERHHRHLRAELNDSKAGVFGLWGPVMLRQEPKAAPATLVSHAGASLSRARALETLVRTSIAQDDLTADDEQQLRDAFEALWASVYGETPQRDSGVCVQNDQGRRATCGVPRH